MATKKGLVGLHSGRQIRINKGKRGYKITPSQTALQAYNSIIKKYGEIVDSAKYHFKGKKLGWYRYSLKNDAKRTGKTTTDIKKWRRTPHRLDYKGIDTKGSRPGIKKVKPARTAKRKPASIKSKDSEYIKKYKLEVSKALKELGASKIKCVVEKWGDENKYHSIVSYYSGPSPNAAKNAIASMPGPVNGGWTSISGFAIFLKRNPERTLPGYVLTYYKNKTPAVYKTDTIAKKFLDDKNVNFTKEKLKKISADPMSKASYTPITSESMNTEPRFIDAVRKIKKIWGTNKSRNEKNETIASYIGSKPRIIAKLPGINKIIYLAWNAYQRSNYKINELKRTGKDKELLVSRYSVFFRGTKIAECVAVLDTYGMVTNWKGDGDPVIVIKKHAGVDRTDTGVTKLSPPTVARKLALRSGKVEAAQSKVKKIKAGGSARKQIKKFVKSHRKIVYKAFLVTGKTYPIRHELNAMGGKWNPEEKGYFIPPKSAKALNRLKKEKGLTVVAFKTEIDPFKRLTAADRLQIRKDKQERKVDRWRTGAGKKAAESQSRMKSSESSISGIVPGQPILVGHHSEARQRKALAKSWEDMGKSIKAGAAAEELSRKADVLEYHTDKLMTPKDLRARIAKLEKEIKTNEFRIKRDTKKIGPATRNPNYQGEADVLKANIASYKRNNVLIKEDIESLKKLLPKEEPSVTHGIKITDIPGAKLKKSLGLKSATKRYHNKNLKGGNFAINLTPVKTRTRSGYELSGYHDPDGVINKLTIGLLYGSGGVGFKKDDLKNFETVTAFIKKVIAATEKK